MNGICAQQHFLISNKEFRAMLLELINLFPAILCRRSICLVGIIFFFFRLLSFSAVGGQFSFYIVHQSAWKPIYMKFLGSPLWIYRSAAAAYICEKNEKNQNQKSLSHHPPPNARSTYSFSSSSCFLFESVHHCDGPLRVLQTIKVVTHYYWMRGYISSGCRLRRRWKRRRRWLRLNQDKRPVISLVTDNT